jgi:hypothetical protein
MKKMMCMLLSAMMLQTMLPGVPTYAETTTATLECSIWAPMVKENGLPAGYDYYTGAVDAKLVEYDADLTAYPDAKFVQVLAEWNNADANPYIVEDVELVTGHYYAIQIDDIPDGYHFLHEDFLISGATTEELSKSQYGISAIFELGESWPKLVYPCDVTKDFTFEVLDWYTLEPVSNVDVTLVRQYAENGETEVLDTWNTAGETVHTFNMLMHFTSNDDGFSYGVKMENLPEGYTYRPAIYGQEYSFQQYWGSSYRQDMEKTAIKNCYYIFPEDNVPEDIYPTTDMTTFVTTTSAVTTTTTTTTTATKPAQKYLLGDVDMDGKIDLDDVIMIMEQYNFSCLLHIDPKKAGDVLLDEMQILIGDLCGDDRRSEYEPYPGFTDDAGVYVDTRISSFDICGVLEYYAQKELLGNTDYTWAEFGKFTYDDGTTFLDRMTSADRGDYVLRWDDEFGDYALVPKA